MPFAVLSLQNSVASILPSSSIYTAAVLVAPPHERKEKGAKTGDRGIKREETRRDVKQARDTWMAWRHTVPYSQAVLCAADFARRSSVQAVAAFADAEDAQIRSTLMTKPTRTKLKLPMGQFEGWISARMAPAHEHLGLKKMHDNMRNQIARSAGLAALHALAAHGAMGTSGTATMVSEVGMCPWMVAGP
jgi:hypothetical protein